MASRDLRGPHTSSAVSPRSARSARRTAGEQLSDDLRAAIARIASRLKSERGEDELGEGAGYVLKLVAEVGPLSLKALSELAHVTPASMSQTVGRLVDDGSLIRERDPEDRRKVLLGVSEVGRRRATGMSGKAGDWLAGELAALTPYERVVLREATQILGRITGG